MVDGYFGCSDRLPARSLTYAPPLRPAGEEEGDEKGPGSTREMLHVCKHSRPPRLPGHIASFSDRFHQYTIHITTNNKRVWRKPSDSACTSVTAAQRSFDASPFWEPPSAEKEAG